MEPNKINGQAMPTQDSTMPAQGAAMPLQNPTNSTTQNTNIFSTDVNHYNVPQAPIISSSPDPESPKDNSISKVFGGRSRADQIAAQAQPSNLRQNAPEFFQQNMQQQDIILNTEAKHRQKSRKKTILGITIGTVVLIGIIALILVVSLLDSNSTENIAAATTQSLLNKYSNFIIIGEAKDEEISDTPEIYNYKMSKITESEANEYFTEAYDLYINYYNELKKLKFKEDNKTTLQIAKDYKSDISITKFVYTDKLDIQDLLSYYYENGSSDTLNHIDNYYADIDYLTSTYKTKIIEYQKNTIRLLDMEAARGCIVQGVYDSDCVMAITDADYITLGQQQSELSQEIDGIEETAITKVKEDIKLLKESLEQYEENA